MKGYLIPFQVRRREVLVAGGATLALPFVEASAGEPDAVTVLGAGRGQSFDLDWRFRLGGGADRSRPELDDRDWRSVDLPHDWSIEDLPGQLPPNRVGPFDASAEGGGSTGYTVGGEGWYRKRFRIDRVPAGARVEILFEGVAVRSEIWINGTRLGEQDHAYAPFAFDLTPYLLRARDNLVAVRVRNLGRNSRWYSGSGIYRPVTIDVVPDGNRFERWGVGAWTSSLNAGRAVIDVRSTVAAHAPGTLLRTFLEDDRGRRVAVAEGAAARTVAQALEVRAPRLWSPDTPELYSLVSELVSGGRVLDRVVQPFGIRVVTIDVAQGLQVNGRRVVLRGGCIHHDNGILGACAYADADERRILKLKARGFNAIRSSHNPASVSLRAACDRHGILLIEEAFDAWHLGKLPDDYACHFATHWREHVDAMVLPARNSPSVIMWSIGNEIPARNTDAGVRWQWLLADRVRSLDPTRPVTAGLNQWLGHQVRAGAGTARRGHDGELDQASTVFLDVAGYNYRLGHVEADHRTYPRRIVFGSETFPKDAFDYAELARRAPYMLGEFVWTAMDYLGEVGIGVPKSGVGPSPIFPPAGFPEISAFCGDLDLIGDQKPQSLWRDVVWGVRPIALLVRRPLPKGHTEWLSSWGWSDELPSWTWPGSTGGAPLRVRVYSSGDRVQLLLDGRLVGERALGAADRMRAEFDVPYTAGTLTAVSWRRGREVAREQLSTIGDAAMLRVVADRDRIAAGRGRLAFVELETTDARGRRTFDARAVELSIAGEAELVAFGSSDPIASGSYRARRATTWHGRALAVLRTTGRAGAVRLEARSAGLEGGAVSLRVG